jgi:hypothetical protein
MRLHLPFRFWKMRVLLLLQCELGSHPVEALVPQPPIVIQPAVDAALRESRVIVEPFGFCALCDAKLGLTRGEISDSRRASRRSASSRDWMALPRFTTATHTIREQDTRPCRQA